jgi:hypothetical protein
MYQNNNGCVGGEAHAAVAVLWSITCVGGDICLPIGDAPGDFSR